MRTSLAIGLMSGTSMDGIDVAVITTDGERIVERGPSVSFPYSEDERAMLRRAIAAARRLEGSQVVLAEGEACDLAQAQNKAEDEALLIDVEAALTEAHAAAVGDFLEDFEIDRDQVQIIGFHGQTVYHAAARHITCQLGDGPLLARLTGIDVIYDFRGADVASGGQGAPLVPAYHRALAEQSGLERPLAIVNIGGVANLTFIGKDGAIGAFDVGPGNGLIDDWVAAHTGAAFDQDGALAAKGKVDQDLLAKLASHPFFARRPPKSLDRYDFPPLAEQGLSVEDGAATLTAFTAWAIAEAAKFLPEPPRQWLLAGGGAKNHTLVEAIGRRVSGPVLTADEVGWSTDHLEAQAFAFLAVRACRKLPLTYPATTGVSQPLTGGRLAKAQRC